MGSFVVGVDVGQARDPSAIAVLECVDVDAFDVRHLERVPLGTPYPALVRRVAEIVRSPAIASRGVVLVVDATGVGRPVVDCFDAERLNPVAVTITGGNGVARDGRAFRVPKRDLATTLLVLLQSRRLRISAHLRERAAVVDELLAFRVRLDASSGHDAYGAASGDQDDLGLATALAAWYGRNGDPVPTPVMGPTYAPPEPDDDPWDWSWVTGPSHPGKPVRTESAASTIAGTAAPVVSAPARRRPFVIRLLACGRRGFSSRRCCARTSDMNAPNEANRSFAVA